MKQMWKIWLLTIVAAFMLAACGGTATETEKPDANETDSSQQEDNGSEKDTEDDTTETTYPLTLKDAVDNEVTLEKAPEKIVSMMPSNTEILFELGLAEEIVGVSDYDDYPAEALEKEKIGGQEFNVEAIIAMDPELVLGHESAFGIGEEGYKQIEAAGIPVFVVTNATSFEETYTTIETIGELTNKNEEATKTIESMKAQVEEVLAKVEGQEEKSVFIETSPAPSIYTPGQNTFMQEIFDMIGAKNIADDQEGWVEMDPEEIVNRNPEVIIVMYDYIPTAVEDVYARDGFETITAIKEEQVIQVDENLTSRTGPRLAQGLEEVAKAVYPEAFGE